ncbi:hypothetical protein K5D38_25320, partial [Pseudomonas cichorii]|nr:hypothetical protein [Pseudomonas cichorii]
SSLAKTVQSPASCLQQSYDGLATLDADRANELAPSAPRHAPANEPVRPVFKVYIDTLKGSAFFE